jgi:PPM family protein phosphatase
MKIRPGNAQHQGSRAAQQDSFGFSDLDDAAFVAHAGFLGVVADGMGGLAHGGAAGAVAVRALLQTYAAKRPDEPLPAALLHALRRANDAVVALARDTNGIGDVGTTAAVAVVHGAALHWIAAGDSRVYLWRAGRLTQVTADHVYAADLDAQIAVGQISEQDARSDPDRDALTSHLGTPSLHRIDRNLEPYPLLEGDRVLICSDGLYRALDPDELAAPLAGAPQRACEALIERAVAKGHPRQDNLTALVIGLDADDVRSESGELGVTVSATPAATGDAVVANVDSAAANFDVATLSRTAGRAANEDYADFLQAGPNGCWVIADGLGGHRGGATASKTVVQAALDSFRQQPEVSIEAISEHITRAQNALLEAQQLEPSLSQMRSTIVVLLAGETDAVWAHVGDSRLYHLRGGKLIWRTRDHSVGQALVDGGQIEPAAQGSHEDRSRLLRCLGKEDEATATLGGPHRLARGDVFLLCTDGFWEALDDVALSLDLAGSEDAAAWLDRLEARLRRRIGPSHDNYTATAIRILNEALVLPPPHDPRAPVHDASAYDAGPAARREAVTVPLHARVPRIALAAALAFVAVLVAAGVWKRAVITAWMRALMAPAAAVTPHDRTPKKAPNESETKPEAKPEAKPESHPGDKPDAPPDASSSSSLSSRPRADRGAAAAGKSEEGAKAPKKQGGAKPPKGAKKEAPTNQDDVKKPDASKTDPATPHAAPIDRPRPKPSASPPREEER